MFVYYYEVIRRGRIYVYSKVLQYTIKTMKKILQNIV